MVTKAVFVTIYVFAIIGLIIIVNLLGKVKEKYEICLRRAMIAAIIAIVANIFVALSVNETMAVIAYCCYFASINWILFFLCGFCLSYVEYFIAYRRLKFPGLFLMLVDSVSIILNLFFHHHFTVFESAGKDGAVFFLTNFNWSYYWHLALDYFVIFTALLFISYKTVKSYSFYRTKYLSILASLILVVFLNLVYMVFSLVLDASVVFYAIAGWLVYISIRHIVPRNLTITTIGRAVDDMKEGIIIFDIDENCVFANTFFVSIFGADMIKAKFDKEPMISVISALENEDKTYGEVEYSGKDIAGKDHNFWIKYSELTDTKGRFIGSYFLLEDKTEEMLFMEQLHEAKVNADKANLAKSTFLASMSHEIRTPLNSVLGMNEMIMRSTSDPLLLEYSNNIKASGDILLSLINDILDFSKIEAGKMELLLSGYSPHKLLRDCYNTFVQMAEGKGLYFRIECDENMPSLLQGDENRIRQIFSNIISNAVKYTKIGGVTVKMGVKSIEEDRIEVLAEISDTGIGIAEEDVDFLFESFRRVNEEQNASIQGTGLGLSITKELITLMDGSIKVKSKLGEGSCFYITIPQKILNYKPAGALNLSFSDTKEKQYKETFKAPGARILVVDDVAVNLKVVEALLRRTEITVETAVGGYEAIERCKETKYDIILLDHRMPEPDGIKTFEIIKEEGLNTDTPVIVLTANALSGAEVEYRQIGFADYLTKPIRSNELELAILRLLPVEKVVIV